MIDATITLVDSGLFTELAVRLAREIAHVRSYVPWEEEFPTVNDRMMGSGLKSVEWIEDPYLDDIFETTDAYVFPDIFRAGDQQLLRRAGKPVFGSNIGDSLETRRIWFRNVQQELGMPVAEAAVVVGWTQLADYLKANDERCFIKTTSKVRGTFETHEFHGWDQEQYWLWDLRVKLGCAAELIMFLIEKPIYSPFETGLDTICIDGQVPKTPMQGIEIKGKLMLSSAQVNSPTPKPLDDALSLLAPILKRTGYRNFLSAEFRQDILTDFCARAPNPGLGCEMEMIKNIGEMVFRGAHGELVEPEFEAEYGIQVAVFHDHDKELPKQFPIDPEVRRWIKLMEFCQVGELYQIIPRPPHGEKIGWLIGIGNTVQKAADHVQDVADQFKNYPFDIKIDALPEAIKQAEAMEKQGMEFSDQPLPDPGEVLEEK